MTAWQTNPFSPFYFFATVTIWRTVPFKRWKMAYRTRSFHELWKLKHYSLEVHRFVLYNVVSLQGNCKPMPVWGKYTINLSAFLEPACQRDNHASILPLTFTLCFLPSNDCSEGIMFLWLYIKWFQRCMNHCLWEWPDNRISWMEKY